MKPDKLYSKNGRHYCFIFDDNGKKISFDVTLDESESSLLDWPPESWSNAFGSGAAEGVRQCIVSFNKAKHTMAQKIRSNKLVGSGREIEVHNKSMIPLNIEAESFSEDGSSQLHVGFDCEGKLVDHHFQLNSNASEVSWDDQFYTNIDGQTDIAKPLLRSIAEFHKLHNSLSEK